MTAKFGINLHPTEPTYTASEVKVLTETAGKFGYELGRKEALTEIADEMGAEQDDPRIGFVTLQTDWGTWRMLLAAKTSSQAAGATSDATSGVPGHRKVSEDRQAVRKRYPHAHACLTCSPDGRLPGPGCSNCRQTGWDQTPCQAQGHKPQCPHDCCDPYAEVSEAVRSPQEPDCEVNGYHQTGPDEAHLRSQCDPSLCGWTRDATKEPK